MRGISDNGFLRIAQSLQVPGTLYHISNNLFQRFDAEFLAQGIVYFAKSRDELLASGHGADANFAKPVYLYTCTTSASHPASWDEFDRYSVDELESQGYDSLDLDDDFVVFDPEKVEIVGIEQIDPSST
jgi:hypothetical protein